VNGGGSTKRRERARLFARAGEKVNGTPKEDTREQKRVDRGVEDGGIVGLVWGGRKGRGEVALSPPRIDFARQTVGRWAVCLVSLTHHSCGVAHGAL